MRALLPWLWPPGDRRLPLLFLGLCACGLAVLWSVTEGIRGPYEVFDPGVSKAVFWRQLVWVALGWATLLLAARIPLRHLEELAPLLYAGALAALLLVLAAGPVVAGARRWFDFGPVRVQPAEMAKICLVLMLARLLARRLPERGQLRPVFVSFGLTAAPFLLVLKEPDLGTALAFPAIWLFMLFWYGTSWAFLLAVGSPAASAVISFYSETVARQAWPWGLYLFLLMGVLTLARFRLGAGVLLLLGNIATGLGIPFLWNLLHPYQQARILTFFDPARDTQGAGYQVFQSKVAIGSGGLLGAGYLHGTQKGLAFLPERHTDFIFAVVGEEFGLLGAAALLTLFLALIMRGLDAAESARRPFGSFAAVGAVGYLCFHVVVNISITSGLLPVTGVPLPLLSYGGSNMLTTSFLAGLLVNVASRDYET